MRFQQRGAIVPRNSITSLVSLLVASMILLGACSAAPAVTQPIPSSGGRIQQGYSPETNSTEPAARVPNKASPSTTSGLPTPTNREQKNEGGSVTMVVTWVAPQPSGDSLRLEVSMDTHSIDLDKYDLTELAVLRDDRGRQVPPAAWDGPPGGGHHRSGALVFPSTMDGRAVVDSDTTYVELVIRDVANVKERVLRWSFGR